ncbi:hypothetical protein BD626DRAFT_473819 [Schizophyllum amplum]|uniref:SET domain-containing protein n=1 Tax=Schizophyllum amplum TaxID=97359 RepID=A0A550CX85_9AGAR|nr:hypothetical protein BD626DRAFT_473819 [Auriculariopsis ampla]
MWQDNSSRASTSSAGASEETQQQRYLKIALDCYLAVKDEVCVSALTVPPPYGSAVPDLAPFLSSITDDACMDVDVNGTDSLAWTALEFDDEGKVLQRHRILQPDAINCPEGLQISPHAKYEAVAPASQSVQAEHTDDTCPFSLYSDDPSFDHHAYVRRYEQLAWDLYCQPMELRIAVETATRLRTMHNLTYHTIDATCITRPFVIDTQRRSQLVSMREERDLHPSRYWQALPENPEVMEEESILDDVNRAIPGFCPLCVSFRCLLHRASEGELKQRYGGFMGKRPTITQGFIKPLDFNLRNARGARPCGPECWKHPDIDLAIPLPNLLEKHERRLLGVLELAPDEAPCALAVIARLPCFVIYQFRDAQFSSEDIVRNKNGLQKQNNAITATSHKPNPSAVIAHFPCNHTGPCSKNRECICFMSDVPCRPSCRCSERCKRKTGGCTCEKRCIDNPKCTCRQKPSVRECDPRRCKHCGASEVATRPDICGNVQLQAQRVASIEVKHSKYGLGAFALHHIRKDQLIGDYTSEIRTRKYMENMNERGDFAPSYIFEFEFGTASTVPVLEGATVGNSTRYLNHAPIEGEDSVLPLDYYENDPERPIYANCDPRETTVDGDLCILIYATQDIEPGEELRINYGPQYWGRHNEEGDIEEEGDTEEDWTDEEA